MPKIKDKERIWKATSYIQGKPHKSISCFVSRNFKETEIKEAVLFTIITSNNKIYKRLKYLGIKRNQEGYTLKTVRPNEISWKGHK